MIHKLGKNITNKIVDQFKENGLEFGDRYTVEITHNSKGYVFAEAGVKGTWQRVTFVGDVEK